MATINENNGKVILITGGAKRIGRYLALELATIGFDICIHAHNSVVEANELKLELEKKGVKAEIIIGNLAEEDFLESVFETANAAFQKPIYGLINSASIFENDSANNFSIAQFETHQRVNLLAPLVLSRNFQKQLKGAQGVIINILDQRLFRPNPLFFTYTLSKAGLAAATKTMAQEFAPNIRVNAIAPGPSIKNARQEDTDFEAQCKASILEIGSPPNEICAAVAYLISAKSVTGQILAVDGGQSLIWKAPDIEGIRE